MNCKLSEEEIKSVIGQVDSFPADLTRLAEAIADGSSVEIFTREKLEICAGDLTEFSLKPILQELKSHPDGVSPKVFKNKECKGIDMSFPKDVAKVMRESNALVYRIELRVYQLISRGHHLALEKLEV